MPRISLPVAGKENRVCIAYQLCKSLCLVAHLGIILILISQVRCEAECADICEDPGTIPCT